MYKAVCKVVGRQQASLFQGESDSRKRDHTQDRKRGWGRDCLPFSKAGDMYLYVDDAEIRQVCYEVFVSKEN